MGVVVPWSSLEIRLIPSQAKNLAQSLYLISQENINQRVPSDFMSSLCHLSSSLLENTGKHICTYPSKLKPDGRLKKGKKQSLQRKKEHLCLLTAIKCNLSPELICCINGFFCENTRLNVINIDVSTLFLEVCDRWNVLRWIQNCLQCFSNLKFIYPLLIVSHYIYHQEQFLLLTQQIEQGKIFLPTCDSHSCQHP